MFIAAVIGAIYVMSFLAVVVVSRHDQRFRADAIVILGAAQYDGRPSPVFQARLDHGIELFQEGWADLIVVTGAIVVGDRMSEATAGQRYLVGEGVPSAQVVVQPAGHSTTGSMDAVAEWLMGTGKGRVILVSDPFHLARLRLEARRLGLTAWTSPTTTSPISTKFSTELRYLLAEAAKLPVLVVRNMIT